MKKLFYVFCAAILLFSSCEKDEETISSIQINQQALTLKIGEQHQFTVNHSPNSLKAPEYKWASSNPQVVSITAEGIITATSIGESTITASALNGSLQSTSLVTVVPIEASGINLSKSELSIPVGKTSLLTFDIEPSNTTYKEVEWSSDNSEIATVINGNVKAVSPGTANIKIKIKETDKEAICKVIVTPIEAESIILNKTELSIFAGESTELTYIISPDSTTYKDVEWTSDNSKTATVSNGIVAAVSPGVANIKVKIKNTNKEAVCQVTVNRVDVTSVSLDQTNIQITKNGTYQLIANINPSNATDKTLIWSSSDTNIATVNNGLVTGVLAGEAEISVKSTDGQFVSTCKVNVIPVPVSGIMLNKKNISLIKGETSLLLANISPLDAENMDVSWSSSNTNIATVDNYGNILALSEGTANITVTTADGGFSSVCNVSVVSITEKITLTISTGGIFNNNGFITGDVYSNITNNSSFEITLTKFEIIDSYTNAVKARSTNPDQLGVLRPGQRTNLGTKLNSVYRPIFIWYFTFNGDSYTVQHQYI